LEQAKTEATAAMAPLTGEQAVCTQSEFSGEPDLDAGVDNDTPPRIRLQTAMVILLNQI